MARQRSGEKSEPVKAARAPEPEKVEEQANPESVESAPAPEPEKVPEPAAAKVEPRPAYEEFKAAAELGMRVEISLARGRGPVLKAGYVVTGEPRVHSLRVALDAGESHLRALATDPDLTVRIVD